MIWRPMQHRDLPEVIQLSSELWAGVHNEIPEVITERLNLYPAGEFVLEKDGKIYGYGQAFPVIYGTILQLSQNLNSIPDGCDCLHVHDILIDPAARGYLYSFDLLKKYYQLAKKENFEHMSMVAILGTYQLWYRAGFRITNGIEDQLKSYSNDNPKYMTFTL
jgi:GNAT superfamily N-acetyltransferase